MIAGRRKCDEEAAGVRGVSRPGEAQSSPVSPGKHCYRVGGIVVVVVVVVVERGWCGWEWEARKTSDWEITLSLARAMPRAACGKASTRRLEERESVCV